jgi:hypothetical protein
MMSGLERVVVIKAEIKTRQNRMIAKMDPLQKAIKAQMNANREEIKTNSKEFNCVHFWSVTLIVFRFKIKINQV